MSRSADTNQALSGRLYLVLGYYSYDENQVWATSARAATAREAVALACGEMIESNKGDDSLWNYLIVVDAVSVENGEARCACVSDHTTPAADYRDLYQSIKAQEESSGPNP